MDDPRLPLALHNLFWITFGTIRLVTWIWRGWRMWRSR